MGHTNSTANLALPQFIGTDKPTWLSDVNGAFSAIDTYAGNNDAALAIVDGKADTAIGDASSAVTTATNAANTAGNAATTATNANTIAGNALTVANGINSKVGVLTNLTTTDKSTVVSAINEVNGKDAGDIAYDNTGSGLSATNVQDAIDEVAQGGGGNSVTVTCAATDTYTQEGNAIFAAIDMTKVTARTVMEAKSSSNSLIYKIDKFDATGAEFTRSHVYGTDLLNEQFNVSASSSHKSVSGITVSDDSSTAIAEARDFIIHY